MLNVRYKRIALKEFVVVIIDRCVGLIFIVLFSQKEIRSKEVIVFR